jgi:hypothetical protein
MEPEMVAAAKEDEKTATERGRKRRVPKAPKKIEADEPEKAEAWQKRLNAQYARFKRLENRQKIVERARRAVYEYLVEMIHENIEHAKQGNSSVAKFLMNFAGIEQLPVPAAPASKRKKAAHGCGYECDDDPMNAVRSFSEKLGMPYPKLKPLKPLEESIESEAVHAMSD